MIWNHDVFVILKDTKKFNCKVIEFNHQEDDSKVVLSQINKTTEFPSKENTITIYIKEILEVDLIE